MSFSSLLGLPAPLQVLSFDLVNNVLIIQVASTASESACPVCQCPTSRIHSHYTRKAADLACGGHQVQLILHVRKFFCTSRDCPRKIFAERLTAFLQPWVRLTIRLGEQIEAIGLASCGRLGARLGSRLKIETSRTNILRRVMKLPPKTTEPVLHLGVDDFSFRRGRTFGTVLVDLQRHQIKDLLPDRQKETAAAWMKMHPEITHVSRDRGSEYASCGFRKGFAAIPEKFCAVMSAKVFAFIRDTLRKCCSDSQNKREVLQSFRSLTCLNTPHTGK